MASTVKIQDVVRSLRPWFGLTPIQSQSGYSQEPALSSANWALQFILAPPFAWRWNRGVPVTFSTTAGTQDYVVASSSAPPNGFQGSPFGWLEKATLTNGSTLMKQLKVDLSLGESITQNEPEYIASQYDNNAGSYTFRLMPVPNAVYTVKLTYQVAAPLLSSLSSTFAPVPDYFYFLYHQGTLAKLLEQANDQRYEGAMETFFRCVTGASDGLTDSQKNIFLQEQLVMLRQQQNAVRR